MPNKKRSDQAINFLEGFFGNKNNNSPVSKIVRADILNRGGLGMEVMHERNAHNFPLDLAAAETTSVALTAPSIG